MNDTHKQRERSPGSEGDVRASKKLASTPGRLAKMNEAQRHIHQRNRARAEAIVDSGVRVRVNLRRDLRLVRRVILAGWEMTSTQRDGLADLVAFAMSSPDYQDHRAAGNLLVAMSQRNLRQGRALYRSAKNKPRAKSPAKQGDCL